MSREHYEILGHRNQTFDSCQWTQLRPTRAFSDARLMRWLSWALLRLLGILLLLATTGWAVLAIHFGDSETSMSQNLVAGLVGLLGLATLFCFWHATLRRPVVIIYSLTFAAVLAWWFSIEPSNNRDWIEEVALLPRAEIEGDRVTVYNIRNFRYRTETDFDAVYYDKSFDLKQLDSVDLYAVYWMGPAIAHVMISFGFAEEDFLVFSIEARKEQGEGYSTIKGFFRQYEQIHIVGDERDLVGLRTNIRDNPPEQVYRYRVPASREVTRKFLLDYLDAVNRQREAPQFYNTLISNCTNVIWAHAHVNPDRVPFSWKILASGYVPEYLYENGRLDTSVSFADLSRRGHANPLVQATGIGDDFSRRLREP